jgi:thiamine-monophosphate kinase
MGEFELLARIRERLPADGPRIHLGSGDDAAITVPAGATATSIDALVEGIHFRRDLATPAQIGHKALATALSDLAAMGAEPGEAYVALGIPVDFGEDECLQLLDGMAALGAATGTSLAGGDLSRSGHLFLAITVVGHASEAGAFLTRGGAQPGDILVLTGELGGAAAGLALLEDPSLAERAGAAVDSLRARQLEPRPRLAAGRALAAAGATAMIDLSDGIGGDARHLAESSGLRLQLDATRLPLAAGVAEVAAALGRDPHELATSGGEDYELLASIPPARLPQARELLLAAAEESVGLTEIGSVSTGSGIEIRLPGGASAPGGFDQLA